MTASVQRLARSGGARRPVGWRRCANSSLLHCFRLPRPAALLALWLFAPYPMIHDVAIVISLGAIGGRFLGWQIDALS